MHGLAVYVKGGHPFAWDVSLENSANFYVCFQLALLKSVSYFFFHYQSPSLSLSTVFDATSCYIDEVLSINPTANLFVIGGFNVNHKDWLTNSGGTERPGELCYNSSISNDLIQMVNSPTQICDFDCQSCSFGLMSKFLLTFSQTQNEMPYRMISFDL